MQIRFGAFSDTGQKRQRNEDALLAWSPRDSWLSGFFVVADGMGGHEAGDVAADTTIDRLRTYIEHGDEPEHGPGNALLDGLEAELMRINSHLREMAAAKEQARGMGSTATAAVFADRQIFIAHIGDTRLYRLRAGELHQLTLDHSWVAEQERRGWISAEQAANHPQKNILTQALGTEGDLEVYKKSFPVRSKDRYLICSDGLHGAATLEQIRSTLRDEPDPEKAAQQLIDSANAAGGPDNVTTIVCDIELTPEELAEPPLPDPEDDGIEVLREVPMDARPAEDPQTRGARLAEMEALHGSPGDSSGGGFGGKWKIWAILGFAILAIAVALIFLR